MTIRPYQDNDLASLAALFTETVHQVNRRDYSPKQITAWAPQPPDLDYWRQRITGLSIWVAESNGTLAGFCGLGKHGHVDLFYVDYRFQHQGIARQLYQELESAAWRNGLRRLFTEASLTARPFFERMGFGNSRPQFIEFRGVMFENIAMEKQIGPEPLKPGPT